MRRENSLRQAEKASIDSLEYAKGALERDGRQIINLGIHSQVTSLLSSHLQKTDSDPIPEWLSI